MPEWVGVLAAAKAWGVAPWEIDEDPRAYYWYVRQMRLDALRSELHG